MVGATKEELWEGIKCIDWGSGKSPHLVGWLIDFIWEIEMIVCMFEKS